jgi:hypothetical protein
MNNKLRSNQGCWTCRLRRKKCDEKHPLCSTCESLKITCYGYSEKPDWMDNGEREKAMANSIKEIVKKTSRHKARFGIPMDRFQVRPKTQTGVAAVTAAKIAPKPLNAISYNFDSPQVMPNAEMTPPATDTGSPATSNDASDGAPPVRCKACNRFTC